MLISFSDEENRFPVSDRLVVGETWISGLGLVITDNAGPEMSAAGSLFPAASALAQRWYSASYCSISSLEMRYLENSPSRFPFLPSLPESAESFPALAASALLARKLLNLERLGKLEDTVDRIEDFSRTTPASTKNSLADGSKFSRLEE